MNEEEIEGVLIPGLLVLIKFYLSWNLLAAAIHDPMILELRPGGERLCLYHTK